MVGHYLLTLTKEQEDRVLLNPMEPGEGLTLLGGRCLLGVVLNYRRNWAGCIGGGVEGESARHWLSWKEARTVANAFDELCARFGTERVTAAIRSRVLCNQLRRSLTAVREEVPQWSATRS